MKFLFCLLFVLPLSYFVSAQSDSYLCYPKDPKARFREHNYDMIKGVINVHFNTQEGIVMGKVGYDFMGKQQQVDTMYLDAPGIVFSEIVMDHKMVKYKQYDEGITLLFEQPISWSEQKHIDLTYTCTPRRGIYFVGWNDEKNLMRKQIWTQGQGVDNRYWIPGYDDVSDKLLTETIITFDKDYEVVSNGILVDTTLNTDGTKTWHYRMNQPMALYLVMIAIDKYAYKDVYSNNGTRIRQYYYNDRPETYAPTYQYSKEMLDWEEQELNFHFPWPSYANCPVEEFLFGAMENTTATIFTDYYLQDERGALDKNYIGVNCHEQTHQWFGDYVTEISGTHHWLQESFATQYAKQFKHFIFGEDEYQWMRRDEMKSAIAANVANQLPIAHSEAGSPRHYPQGSIVLDMLRYVAGNEQYRKVITEYLKKHPYQNVESNDLYRSFYDVLGMNLDWFFDEWVYRGGIPEYTVAYTETSNGMAMYVHQTHAMNNLTGVFTMPINMELHYTDGTKDSFQVWNKSVNDTFNFIKSNASKKISYVLFDANNNILKTVNFEKPYAALIAQAKDAPHMIDRYDAVLGLKKYDFAQKRNDLINLYNREKFYGIRAEIVAQLAKDSDVVSQKLMVQALADTNFLVRRSALDNAAKINKKILKNYEALLTDVSYLTIENALNKLCEQYPKNVTSYLETTKNVIGYSKNVRITWLQNYLKYKDSTNLTYKNELIDYASHSYEFRTRTKAMQAIDALHIWDEKLMASLIEAAYNTNGRLSGPAIATFKSLAKQETFMAAAKKYYTNHTWKDWQKEILDKIWE